MPFLSEAQRTERTLLADAIRSLAKPEPRQFGDMIHNHVVTLMHEEGADVDTVLDQLRFALADMEAETVVGDNVDGWRRVRRGLTAKQQRVIHAWMTLALKSGMRFSPYEADSGDD